MNRPKMTVEKMRNSFAELHRAHAPVVVRQIDCCETNVAVDVLQQRVVEESILSDSDGNIAIRIGLCIPKIADDIPHYTLGAMS